MDQPDAPEKRIKPSLRGAFVSLPFASNSIFGWMIFSSFWMPFAVGCDNKSIIIPSETLTNEPPTNVDEWVGFLLLHWPYLFAALLSVLMMVIVCARPVNLAKWLLWPSFVFLISFILLGVYGFATDSSDGDPREKFGWALVFLCPPVAVLIWSLAAIRSGDRLLAAIRTHCGLSLLMPPMFYFYSMISFSSRLLIGFYLAVAASIGITVSSWLLYARGEQTFCDGRIPKRKIRYRIRTLMVWTTIVAGVAALTQNLQQ